ncbi:MAG: hypothetical protein WAW54_05215 [Parvibaculum sedimenti]|uniref:hypothetical protein n=1 Tax=Parvibaculum sedimenti TaxID=2608632 RepID=UPI003BB61BA2
MQTEGHLVIDLEAPETWPLDVRKFLAERYELFLDWADGPTRFGARVYDGAILALSELLQPYAVTGWHCTRLTLAEIAVILDSGLSLPDARMLDRRIDALVELDMFSQDVGKKLKAENQAHEKNRAGMVWFCFFPPHLAGESGIGDFMRFWGGEALYNSHDQDPLTGPAIRSIGIPAIVEADVPISSLASYGLVFKMVRRFLISRGYQTTESCDHEDRIKQPLPATCIRRVIRFPEFDFMGLSGCALWKEPLVIFPDRV